MKKEIDIFGTIHYYNDKGQFHREDGPAVEYVSGTKHWYRNGLLHREDGPAIECSNGYKAWYKNGLRHREDGPAIKYVDGDKDYYYNDIWYPYIKTNKEWMRFIKLMVFL